MNAADWSTEWLGDTGAAAPWLFDSAGLPVLLPREAVGFRVRYLPPSSRGIGEMVLDELTGVPLLVPVGVGPEEFLGLVRHKVGRYRLAAVDERYQYLRDCGVACFVVTPAMVARAGGAEVPAPGWRAGGDAPRGPAPTEPLVLELVGALRGALTECLAVIKGHGGEGARNVSDLVRATATVITAADGAGISRRDPLPPLPAPAAPAALPAAPAEPGAGIADVLMDAVEKLTPVIQHWTATKVFGLSPELSASLIQAMASKTPPAAPAADAAAATPGAPTAPASEVTGAALVAHLSAIDRLLNEAERAVLRRYLSTVDDAQRLGLIEQVRSRSPEEAVAWIRAMLAATVAGAPAGGAA
jgi:hypothetical protein